GPEGLVLRDLGSETGTTVNGEAVASCQLQDDDLLSVGPFRFRVRLPQAGAGTATKQFLLRELEVLQKEKEALRIQAAAVVAQQAALTEGEVRLEQRRAELERQEEQLAGHLEEKRARLLDLQSQVREARAELEKDRAAYEGYCKATLQELERDRREGK